MKFIRFCFQAAFLSCRKSWISRGTRRRPGLSPSRSHGSISLLLASSASYIYISAASSSQPGRKTVCKELSKKRQKQEIILDFHIMFFLQLLTQPRCHNLLYEVGLEDDRNKYLLILREIKSMEQQQLNGYEVLSLVTAPPSGWWCWSPLNLTGIFIFLHYAVQQTS